MSLYLESDELGGKLQICEKMKLFKSNNIGSNILFIIKSGNQRN